MPFVVKSVRMERRGVAEKRGLRLFTKNTGLCEHASGRIGSDACPVLEGQGELSAKAKQRTEAPVNGGRNNNGPKVAKFLVG